ncbi:hypothetical protein DMA11_01930 [Marinilabiliaceae bacterium JC017]|nr:hypothetical protein DMA11_01930 [Marinilabiliaceae bacterium JC017]
MEHKEQIKDRMLKTAARVWDQANIRDEASFDPLVGMLVTACASEMENISREIHQTQNRVTEKLMEWINPEVNGGVRPGHGIACAQPTEATFNLTGNYRFYTKTKKADASVGAFQFLPAGSFNLFQGGIKYMATCETLSEIVDNRYQAPLATNTTNKTINNSDLWLGIQLPETEDPLTNLHLYFDIKGESRRKNFFFNLAKTNWFCGDQHLITNPGINHSSTQAPWLEKVFKGQMSTYNACVAQVTNYYQQQFICLESLPLTRFKNTPAEILGNFDLPEELEKDLCWIRVCFKDQLFLPEFDALTCHANAFPVINLSLQQKIFRSGENLNLFCLMDHEHFFDIKKIENDRGDQYAEYSADNINHTTQGTYLLRQDGVASFDSSNAANTISYLLGKLRNESTSLNVIRSKNFSNDIRTLGQITAKLEQKLQESNHEQSPVYLFLRGNKASETVFVDYWTTCGASIDRVREHSRLKIFEGSDLMQPGALLLTPLKGGRDKLSPEERIQNNRHLILSGDKIVTNRDVETCLAVHFGNQLSDTKIERGIMESPDASVGFLRTIDIKTSADYNNQLPEDLLLTGKDFLADLEKRGSNLFPYRLFINDQLIEK